MHKLLNIFIFISLILAVFACGNNADVPDVNPYDRPLLEVENMVTLYSDSAKVKVKVEAQRQLEFESGDSEFPEGVYVEFYDENQKISSTLKANYGYYTKKENLYKAIGDVEVNSFENDEKLNTEELFWEPDKAQIYTDKFVRIETGEEILLGEGLTATQDFSSYKILKPTGELSIEQD